MVPYNNDIDEQQDRVITDFHFNLRRQKDSEMQKREPQQLLNFGCIRKLITGCILAWVCLGVTWDVE